MDRALGLALAAEAEFRARHDAVNRLAALNVAGAAQFELGDLEGAESRFSDLLELAGERGDDEMLGRATNNLASLASLRGDHERALSLFQLATTAYQKVGFRFGLAQAAHNLGIVYRDLGYWRESDRHYSQALRRARQLGDKRLAAMARVGRSEVFFLRGDRELATLSSRSESRATSWVAPTRCACSARSPRQAASTRRPPAASLRRCAWRASTRTRCSRRRRSRRGPSFRAAWGGTRLPTPTSRSQPPSIGGWAP
jgi:tetratricopeptide (TPR) repeat protein